MADWAPGTPEERAWYDNLFIQADTEGKSKVAGAAAVTFFTKSGLEIGVLKQVPIPTLIGQKILDSPFRNGR